ncbi:MAG: glycoside hydrolase family 3 N-terminal domain-containing protein [Candidatus Cyclobacteriaceae bacterium M2_1C_046]
MACLISIFQGKAQIILPEQDEWVDSVFSTLDTEQKIGQLIMIPAYAGGNEEHYKDLINLLKDHHIGGVVFMEGNPITQAKLTNTLQENSSIPLLTGMEADFGLGQHLDSTLIFPSTLTLGALSSDSLLYATGKEVARQLQRLGIHFILGPSVNISNPLFQNAFSDNLNQVVYKAKYYLKGLEDGGIIIVLKDFPGMGSIDPDNQENLAVTKKTLAELKEEDLYPFKSLTSAGGIGGVMSSFIFAPNIVNDGLPLSMNKNFINKNVRDDWRFEGIVFTGPLNQESVTNNFKKGIAEEHSLKAGHDILLFPDNIPATIRRIKRALNKEELKLEQLDASVKRILTMKYQAGLQKSKPVDTVNIYQELNNITAHKLQREVFLNSITLVRNNTLDIPYQMLEDRNFALLDLRNNSGGPLLKYLKKYTHFDYYSILNNDFADKLKGYDMVVTAISGNLTPEQKILLKDLDDATHVTLLISGSPYQLAGFEEFNNIVWSGNDLPITQELIPQLLFGAESFSGKLPVTTGPFISGTGISTKSLNRLAFTFPEDAGIDGDYLIRIDSIMKEAIQGKATPGGQILIARKGKVVWEKAYGYHTYDSLMPVDDLTIYDLASVTKVAASVQALMFLYERGLIDLDKKISVYLPELEGTNKENMVLRDILTHQAGLWPYLPFWKATMLEQQHSPEFYSYRIGDDFLNEVSPGLYSARITADSVWQWVIESKVREKSPREPYDYKYSDMGYYIIHRLVQNIVNQPMQDFLNQNLYDPMGMTTLDYQPLCNFPLTCIAPTEMDDYFRFTLVSGTVHDQGAALLGGVAGHAGLFSNALDLGKLMQLMLQKGNYGGQQYFQPETIELFTRQQYSNNRRGLGWDKPVTDEWGGPTSEFASGKTFGHTGFTGTAAWVDPEFDLVYIFLSNRIYPDATNTKLITENVRTRIQDIIYKSIFQALRYEDIQ